jgi:hypothetical protein
MCYGDGIISIAIFCTYGIKNQSLDIVIFIWYLANPLLFPFRFKPFLLILRILSK